MDAQSLLAMGLADLQSKALLEASKNKFEGEQARRKHEEIKRQIKGQVGMDMNEHTVKDIRDSLQQIAKLMDQQWAVESEPSRLEIAAMCMAQVITQVNRADYPLIAKYSLEAADMLIAAAKGDT